MKTAVRVNGTGSAWPVMIGDSHPVYSSGGIENLSNASYSLIRFDGNEPKTGIIDWEAMIDMGHNTVPYLIKNENRIPEIVALTHGHADHFFGIDWVVQSYYSKYGIRKKYPIYATRQVWESVLRTFNYLDQIAELRELLPGIKTKVNEIEGLTIIAIPVYHGESARGASMLYFENEIADMDPVLFTGDMLCPLWRKKDFHLLKKASQVFIDCTNRFPYPGYNHMSFTSGMPITGTKSEILVEWINKTNLQNLLSLHISNNQHKETEKYFEEFSRNWENINELPFSIVDFLKSVPISSVNLVHYSGTEDRKFYNQQILNRKELEEWATKQAKDTGIENTTFCFPEVGQLFYI